MHTLAFFTPNLQLCDFGFYGAVLELASKKVLRRAAEKKAAAKRRTGIRKEEKDGRNRNASGRKTVPGQNQHKQRTYPQKTSGEEKNGICLKRHLFNSAAVCRTVSRLLAGTDGNPAYGGDKHGGRSYPSSDYRRAFYRAVCGKRLWHGAEKHPVYQMEPDGHKTSYYIVLYAGEHSAGHLVHIFLFRRTSRGSVRERQSPCFPLCMHGSGLCSAAVYPQAFGGAVPGGQVTDYRGNDADTEMISNITAANPKINSVLTEKYLHLSK